MTRTDTNYGLSEIDIPRSIHVTNAASSGADELFTKNKSATISPSRTIDRMATWFLPFGIATSLAMAQPLGAFEATYRFRTMSSTSQAVHALYEAMDQEIWPVREFIPLSQISILPALWGLPLVTEPDFEFRLFD